MEEEDFHMFQFQPPTTRFFDPPVAIAAFLIVALVLLIGNALRYLVTALARGRQR